jgi:hypothetical protein
VTINKKILKISKFKIPESRKISRKQRIQIPLDKLGKFKDIIEEVILEDH